MDYLNGLIKQILLEQVENDFIVDAIKKRYEVEISYMPDKNGRGGEKRVIQPVAYGTTTAGNSAVRAFQPFGDSSSNNKPYWRLFLTDKIKTWKPYKKRRFNEPPGFNRSGDDKMSEVFVIANFDNSGYLKSGLKRYNDDRARKKEDNDQLYGLKKNMERSYNIKDMSSLRRNIEDWQKSDASRQFKANGESVYDMQVANNFGEEDNDEMQTVGPVTKNNTEIPQDSNNSKPNYANVRKNGPVYKGDEENNNENDNIEDNGSEEYKQYPSESTADDAKRQFQQRR